MKNRIAVLILVAMSWQSCVAQTKEGKLPKNNLMSSYLKRNSQLKTLDTFLRNQKAVEFNVVGKEDYDLFLFNLLTMKEGNVTDSTGIYVFGQPSSHPNYFLSFKNKDGSFDVIQKGDYKIELVLNELSEHLKKNNIVSEEIYLKYVYGITKYFNHEMTYPISDKCLPVDWSCE